MTNDDTNPIERITEKQRRIQRRLNNLKAEQSLMNRLWKVTKFARYATEYRQIPKGVAFEKMGDDRLAALRQMVRRTEAEMTGFRRRIDEEIASRDGVPGHEVVNPDDGSEYVRSE